jgi:hypothetical protein
MKTIWTTKIQPILCSNIIEEKEQLVKKYLSKEEDYLDIINDLKVENKELDQNLKSIYNINKELEKDLSEMNATALDLQFKLSKYTKEDKHLTLETFMDWLKENVKPVNKTHKLNADLPNRTIRNSLTRPSHFLKRCVTEEDKIKILEFAEEVLYYTSFTDEDDLVYKFNIRFDNKFPTRTYYSYDQDLFKIAEYWATPMQTINLIKTKKTYGDCDDVSHLKYWCLKLLLNKYFPNWDKNRLRCFLNFAMMRYYHAMLAWVKKDVNDWIPIETTYFNENFKDFWINNMRLRTNQIGYKVNFSYDTEAEYIKI